MSISTDLNEQAKGSIRVASPWIEGLARLGFIAKGVVYALIGVLAIQVAFGGGAAPGTEDAFQTIAAQPFGQILLGLVAFGLVGYAIWLLVRAGMDTDNQGSDAEGIIKRVGYAIDGVIHMGLAFYAVTLVVSGIASSGGESSMAEWTAWLMAQPFGRWLVGIGGAIGIGVGLYKLYKAYSTEFTEVLNLSQMSQTEREWTIRLGRAGIAAQGIVFAIIGGFFVQAAWQYQPSEARGLGGALQSLADQPYGPWLLTLVALGLVAHGIYMMFIVSQYRRINVA